MWVIATPGSQTRQWDDRPSTVTFHRLIVNMTKKTGVLFFSMSQTPAVAGQILTSVLGTLEQAGRKLLVFDRFKAFELGRRSRELCGEAH
jgi:hypothetical protein